MILGFIGALGLFLIGMWLMTEGLKLAGGTALKNILSRLSASRLRGLGAGIMITALVQSSSAVTVAVIGFVNAGLMPFRQALWLVFGSNVGTTATAWIVTLLGFSIKIDLWALPILGVGALLHLFYPGERGRQLGLALAGFGLLFLGIAALKELFLSYQNLIDVEATLQASQFKIPLALGLGILLTVLTQSSSAAIAIILSAAATQVASFEIAAAAVIGSNIGTTSTALMASVGATVNAKRLAAAHIAFNGIAAVVALLLFPFFLQGVMYLGESMGEQNSHTVLLAIFHTCFNVLGVVLMWPLEKRLSHYLQVMIREKSSEQSTQYLDANVASVPELALQALQKTLTHLYESQCQLQLLALLHNSEAWQHKTHSMNASLQEAEHFIEQVLKSSLNSSQSAELSRALGFCYHMRAALLRLDVMKARFSELSPALALQQRVQNWAKALDTYVADSIHYALPENPEKLARLYEVYAEIKKDLIQAIVKRELGNQEADIALQAISVMRRYFEQLRQAQLNLRH